MRPIDANNSQHSKHFHTRIKRQTSKLYLNNQHFGMHTKNGTQTLATAKVKGILKKPIFPIKSIFTETFSAFLIVFNRIMNWTKINSCTVRRCKLIAVSMQHQIWPVICNHLLQLQCLGTHHIQIAGFLFGRFFELALMENAFCQQYKQNQRCEYILNSHYRFYRRKKII